MNLFGLFILLQQLAAPSKLIGSQNGIISLDLSDFTTCSDGLGLKKMGPEWTLYLYFVPKYADDADEALMP